MGQYPHALVCGGRHSRIEANAGQFDDCEVVALRIGGGTASNAGQGVWDIVRTIHQGFTFAEGAQVTMRCAVSNISGANFPYFIRSGIQRYDFEMMSVYQGDFATFNHIDSFENFAIACDNFLHSYANDSLGLNLLYGHRDMPALDFRRCMLAARSTHVSHITLQLANEEFRASDKLIEQHLADAREVLGDAGFTEYLPAVFAREGQQDRYLVGRSQHQETLSFGLGARTLMDGSLSTNTSDLATYLEASDDFSRITVDVHPV